MRIDAVPEHVAIARGFAAAGLQVLDVDEELTESIRLIVSELVTILVENAAGAITVELDPAGRRFVIGSGETLPPVPEPIATILHALEGASVESVDQGWIIRWNRG